MKALLPNIGVYLDEILADARLGGIDQILLSPIRDNVKVKTRQLDQFHVGHE